MEWKETAIKILKYIANYCIEHPYVAILGLFGFLMLSLLFSHWLDTAEGTFRNKALWLIFMIIIALIVLLVLFAIKGGSINLDILNKSTWGV